MFLPRRIYLLNIINEMEIIRGEVFLQKYIYFLQVSNLDGINYYFDKHNFGPFSYDLKGDLEFLKDEGFIEYKTDMEPHLICANKEKIEFFLEEYESTYNESYDSDYLIQRKIRDIFTEELKTIDRIELFATMHMLITRDSIALKEKVFRAVEKWKPKRFPLIDKNDIWELLIGYKMLPKRIIDFNNKIEKLNKIKPGPKHAHAYHIFIKEILEFLFRNQLQNFKIEDPVNLGKKRIDITAQNNSKEGFFFQLRNHHNVHSPFILFECKNLNHDLENPQLDQMIGRFSYGKGYFGIISCRKIADYSKVLEHIRDIYNKNCLDKYYVIVIDDSDIKEMLLLHLNNENPDIILENKFKELIFNYTDRK